MSWLSNTMDRVKDATSADPVECPRGWGSVPFTTKVDVAWPWWVSLDRKCPIGNVDSCVKCRHSYNPAEIDALSERLTELDSLRNRNGLSSEELAYRRRLILQMRDGLTATGSEQGLRIAAWILGPLGTLITSTGVVIGMTLKPVFWFIAAGGGVMLALTLSFAAISSTKKGEDHDV